MAQQTVFEILYNLKDNASKRFQSASGKIDKSAQKTSKQVDKTGKSMNNLGATIKKTVGVIGGLIVLRQVGQWLLGAANAAENYKRSLAALGFQTRQVGVDQTALIDTLQKVTRGQVSRSELIVATNRAVALIGNQAIPKMEELAEVSLKASQVMNQSVGKSLNDIAIGIGRQSRLILDNLGLIISASEANEKYAKSIGKAADDLTNMERKQAFLNATLEQAKVKFGNLNVTLSSSDGLIASYEDMKIEIGEKLIPTKLVLIDMLTQLIEGGSKLAFGNEELTKSFIEVGVGAKFASDAIDKIISGGVGRLQGPKTELAGQDIFGQGAEQAVKNSLGKALDAAQARSDFLGVLNTQLADLKKELDFMNDPAIMGKIRNIQKLQKQIGGILSPAVKKATKEMTSLRSIFQQTFGSETGDKIINFMDAFNTAITKNIENTAEMAKRWNEVKGVFEGIDFKGFGFSGPEGFSTAFKSQKKGLSKGIKGLDLSKPVGGQLKPKVELDTTSLSLQFALSITNAFRSQSVVAAIGSVLQSGVSLAASLSKAGAASGDPYIAGIALAVGLIDSIFGGGRSRLPSPSEVFDVRIVEITGQAATTMLGISQRRIIAPGGIRRGPDFREALRVM